jgi:hypothetical protein
VQRAGVVCVAIGAERGAQFSQTGEVSFFGRGRCLTDEVPAGGQLLQPGNELDLPATAGSGVGVVVEASSDSPD